MVVRYTYRGEEGEVIPRGATHVFIHGNTVPVGAFHAHPNIEEVICSEDVGTIEEGAFCRCPRLRKVVMPDVRVVEDSAFNSCPALTDVICGILEIIEDDAFCHCTSLSSIDLSSVRVVKKGAFYGCRALTNAKFSDKLEAIEELAFNNCPSLERITVPLKLGIITDDDDNIFLGCENLKHIDLFEEEELRETVAALHLEEWRNDMIEEIDCINRMLPNARAGTGDKARVITEWIERVLGKINDYQEEHRRILDEAATTLELALWKKSLHESDQASEGVEGAEESITCPVKKRKAELAASDPARAECRVACGADMNVVIKNVLPFLELPSYKYEMEGDGSGNDSSDPEDASSDNASYGLCVCDSWSSDPEDASSDDASSD